MASDIVREYSIESIRADYQGGGKIGSFMTGAVTRGDGVPVSTVVLISNTRSGLKVTSALSDSSGAWSVVGLNMDIPFTARIKDPSRQLNGAVLDWIQPVPME